MQHPEQVSTPAANQCSAILQILTSVSDMSNKVMSLAENEPDIQLKSDLYQFVSHIYRETALLLAKIQDPAIRVPALPSKRVRGETYWSPLMWARFYGYVEPNEAQHADLIRRCEAVSDLLRVKHTGSTIKCFSPYVLNAVLPSN